MKPAFLAMIALGMLPCTSSAAAQTLLTELPLTDPPEIPCPNATTTILTMTSPGVVNSEFTPAILTLPRLGLNDNVINKVFLGTFWLKKKKPACCQITGAVLTVVVRANIPGGSAPTSGDAGNDSLSVWGGGSQIAGLGGPVYPNGPVATNQTETKTIVMNPAALAKMNSNQLISFLVQDDSSVLSATLRFDRCCLN